MNVKELRVGSLITSKTWKGIHKISAVIQNKSNFDVVVNGFTHIFKDGYFCEIAPIPLNKEVLIKLGFAPLSDSDHGLRLSVNSVDELSWSFNEKILKYQTKGSGFTRDYNIKYVHQLQNLYFALTGKELEVKS